MNKNICNDNEKKYMYTIMAIHVPLQYGHNPKGLDK
jgi:hypothetical protein